MRARSTTFALAAALSLAATMPRLAEAQEPSATDRETARSLLLDGRAKRDKHDYEGALKSLKAAHAIMHVPTTGLDYAQVLELVGQLVEARTTALDVTRSPVKEGEPEAFREARTKAAALAQSLEKRIPAVVIVVKGLPADREPTVTLDGASVPVAALGLPRKVNPGAHLLVVTATGFARYEQKVDVAEGGAPVALDVAMTADATPPQDTTAHRAPLWPWIAGGVGVVGLAVGIGFAADYAKVKSNVSSDCPGNACLPAGFNAANALEPRWNRDVGLMVFGLGVGVAGVTAAVVGLTQKPASAPATRGFSPTVTPWFDARRGGNGGLAIRGGF